MSAGADELASTGSSSVKTGETQSVLLPTHASCVSGLVAPGLAPPRNPDLIAPTSRLPIWSSDGEELRHTNQI
jgi:hypothetical protein